VIVFDYSTGHVCFSQIVAPKDSISSLAFCAGFEPLKGQSAVAFEQFLLVGTAQGSMYRITISFYAQESSETMEIKCRHGNNSESSFLIVLQSCSSRAMVSHRYFWPWRLMRTVSA
jgi:hypothetical protein